MSHKANGHASAVILVLIAATMACLGNGPSWPLAVALVALVALFFGLGWLELREEDERINEALARAQSAEGVAQRAVDEVAEVKKTAGRAFEAATQPRRAGPPSY